MLSLLAIFAFSSDSARSASEKMVDVGSESAPETNPDDLQLRLTALTLLNPYMTKAGYSEYMIPENGFSGLPADLRPLSRSILDILHPEPTGLPRRTKEDPVVRELVDETIRLCKTKLEEPRYAKDIAVRQLLARAEELDRGYPDDGTTNTQKEIRKYTKERTAFAKKKLADLEWSESNIDRVQKYL